jgi:hypothetical protein
MRAGVGMAIAECRFTLKIEDSSSRRLRIVIPKIEDCHPEQSEGPWVLLAADLVDIVTNPYAISGTNRNVCG